MRPTDNIEKMVRNWNESTSAGMDDRVLADIGRALERSQIRAAPTGPSLWRTIMRSPITRLAIAAAIVLAASVVLSQFGKSLESVAWADVAQRFESVPFFSMVVYTSPSTSAPGKRTQIWKSQDSRVRVDEADKVVFADFSGGKKDIVAFDRSTRTPVDPGMFTKMLLETLCPEGQFSLNTLIGVLSSDGMNLVPVETDDTAATREIAVFEAKRADTGETLRIWTLRNSKLPMQMRFRDPRSDEYGDFLFDYTQKKEPAFFDPQAFQQSASAN